MTTKEIKLKRRQTKPDSPAQAAVKLYGRRLFAQGSTTQLIRALKELGYKEAAAQVEGAIILLKEIALQEYEAERLRLDPSFETASMRRDRLLREDDEEYKKFEAEHKRFWNIADGL